MAQQTIRLDTRNRHAIDAPALSLSILSRVLNNVHPRDFAIRFWNGETIPPDANVAPRFTLVLNRAGALRRMFIPPNDLALGEAFLRGDFDIEGDIIAAMELGGPLLQTPRSMGEWIALGRDLLALPNDPGESDKGRQRAKLRGAVHSRERDRAAIQYH